MTGDQLIADPPALCFIGGTGRAGGGITHKALGLHSQIAALPFEPRILIDPDGIVDFYNTYDQGYSPFAYDLRVKRLATFLDDLGREKFPHRIVGKQLKKRGFLTPRRYSGWRLAEIFSHYDVQVEALLDGLAEFRFTGRWVGSQSYQRNNQIIFSAPRSKAEMARIMRRFFHGIIQPYLKKHGKKLLSYDDSWNMLYARELSEIFPQAKFIHVYRDPRDVVTSFITKTWCPSRPEDVVRYYQWLIGKSREVARAMPEEKILEISIENLVREQEKSFRRICKHIGLPYDANMLNVGLSTASMGRWRRELTQTQQDFVNSELSLEIADLNYE